MTVTRGDHRRRGIRIHRIQSFAPDEVTTLDGIPITTPARTLLDLAASLPSRDLERALVDLLADGRTSRDDVLMLTNRYPRSAGSTRLRALLAGGEPALTRSEAERTFLALIESARLPKPETNVWVEGHRVDFVWRTAKLIVEIDGFTYHSTRGRVATDKRRDFDLSVAGYRVIRFTRDQLVDEPNLVLVQFAQALARPLCPKGSAGTMDRERRIPGGDGSRGMTNREDGGSRERPNRGRRRIVGDESRAPSNRGRRRIAGDVASRGRRIARATAPSPPPPTPGGCARAAGEPSLVRSSPGMANPRCGEPIGLVC